MTKSIKVLLAILTAGILMAPATVAAFGPFSDVCSNGDANSSAVCNSTSKTDSKGNPVNPLVGPDGLLLHIANIIAYIAGAAAIILIIVSGLRFITAGGDSNKAASARATIVNALIGLVVIVLGTVLIDFVLSKL
jgi:hypothetical protein